MAFNLDYEPNGIGEGCDKCKLIDDRPLIILTVNSRADGARIWIHEHCLLKAIHRAKPKEAANV